MNPPSLRPRTDEDLPALVRVLRRVHETDQYPTVWPTDPAAFVAATPLAAWVAETDGQPLGQMLLCAVPPGSVWATVPDLAAEKMAEVKRLFVAPEVRGTGLAQQLMQRALAESGCLGLRAVLQTHTDNTAAQRFYERAGWRPCGTVSADWTDLSGQHPQMLLYAAPTQRPTGLETPNI